jgi:hypothetical protein
MVKNNIIRKYLTFYLFLPIYTIFMVFQSEIIRCEMWKEQERKSIIADQRQESFTQEFHCGPDRKQVYPGEYGY